MRANSFKEVSGQTTVKVNSSGVLSAGSLIENKNDLNYGKVTLNSSGGLTSIRFQEDSSISNVIIEPPQIKYHLLGSAASGKDPASFDAYDWNGTTITVTPHGNEFVDLTYKPGANGGLLLPPTSRQDLKNQLQLGHWYFSSCKMHVISGSLPSNGYFKTEMELLDQQENNYSRYAYTSENSDLDWDGSSYYRCWNLVQYTSEEKLDAAEFFNIAFYFVGDPIETETKVAFSHICWYLDVTDVMPYVYSLWGSQGMETVGDVLFRMFPNVQKNRTVLPWCDTMTQCVYDNKITEVGNAEMTGTSSNWRWLGTGGENSIDSFEWGSYALTLMEVYANSSAVNVTGDSKWAISRPYGNGLYTAGNCPELKANTWQRVSSVGQILGGFAIGDPISSSMASTIATFLNIPSNKTISGTAVVQQKNRQFYRLSISGWYAPFKMLGWSDKEVGIWITNYLGTTLRSHNEGVEFPLEQFQELYDAKFKELNGHG